MAGSILTRARPLLLARLAAAVLGLAVPMVLARVLLPASYGTFKQGFLLSQTIVMMLPMGLTQSLYYFVPRHPAARDRIVAQTVWIHLGLAVLAAAIVLLGRPLVAQQFENEELTRNLGWVAAFTALQLAGSPLDLAWNASGRIGAAALVRLATDGGRSLAVVAGAALAGTVEGTFVAMAAAAGLRAAYSLAVLVRAHGLRGDAALLRRQIAYSLPFGLAFLLIVPQQQFHQYAVGAAVTAAAFAVYSVGTFQLPIVEVLYTPGSELLQIGIAEADGAGRPARAGLPLFHEAVQQLAFVFVPVTGLLVVVAPQLIEFVFSPVYREAVPIFRLSAFTALLASLPMDGVMRARAQNRFMLVLSGAKLAATVPFVLGGFALLGPIGALAGWQAAEALARVAMLAHAASLFDAPYRRILPLRALGRQVTATAFAMVAAWLALHAFSGGLFPRLAASGLAFGAAYVGLCWAKGWLPAGWIAFFRARRAEPAAAQLDR
jgi:O-antigen/teichoic acid export membrane protein